MAPHTHPLDKLISDDRIFLLEAMLPFVNGPMRQGLTVYVKLMELQQILAALHDKQKLASCRFNRNINDQNDILSSLSECGFSNIAEQMQQMSQVMELMSVMNRSDAPGGMPDVYQDLFREYDRQTGACAESEPNDSQMEHAPNASFTRESSDAYADPLSNIMELFDDYDRQHGRFIS